MITTGSTPSRSHPEFWGGEYPWVSAEDMKEKYVYDTAEKITALSYAACKHLPVNTLMYVCRGSIGVMAINKIECATNQSICTATCDEHKCKVEYLYHALLYKKEDIKQIGIGTNFKSLNQSTFSSLQIIVPPIEKQETFVQISQQADKSKQISEIDVIGLMVHNFVVHKFVYFIFFLIFVKNRRLWVNRSYMVPPFLERISPTVKRKPNTSK